MGLIRKLKNFAHLLLAISANAIYLFPSRGLTVVGVTGTDGKTTTSSLIYHILKANGQKVAIISTLGAIIDGKKYQTGFHVTTPSPFSIQKYLRMAKTKGCTHVILEVTSHALDQNRVWGIKFGVGVLTNITHEHLDYHKTYENYVAAKLKLLQNSELSVVNSNGEWFSNINKALDKKKLITYSLHGAYNGDLSLGNVGFNIKTNLLGEFNLENILAAVAVSRALGVSDSVIDKAIQKFEAPEGRQEIIAANNGVNIIIDFAHTPNAFKSILPEVKKITTGRLIHVFGAAGKRDVEKRPEMGLQASYFDDIIILTAEDPRNEKITDINLGIIKGIPSTFELVDDNSKRESNIVFQIDDRKKAIEFALSRAKKNDTVIITGKGHEKSLNYGQGEIPWSDRNVVDDFLKQNNEV